MSENSAPFVFQEPVSLADEDAVKELLVGTVLQLWGTVNNLTRIRPTKRDRYRVTLFGSARTKPGTYVYEEVKRVSAILADLGCDVVTGGGPGLMQAANEGAASVGANGQDRSLGIRIGLPFEQAANPHVGQLFEHQTFFSRLHHFILISDAFVVAPGGIGTVLEAVMVWQLLQVRHLYDTPLILVGEMWKGLLDWAQREMSAFDPPMASEQDFAIPTYVETGDEVMEILKGHLEEWKKKHANET